MRLTECFIIYMITMPASRRGFCKRVKKDDPREQRDNEIRGLIQQQIDLQSRGRIDVSNISVEETVHPILYDFIYL